MLPSLKFIGKLSVLEVTLALVVCHLYRLSDAINYIEKGGPPGVGGLDSLKS